MNGLIPPCCLGNVKYLGYSEAPYPLSMKDVNLSFLLSFQFSSLILVLFFQVETFVRKERLLVCVKYGLVHVVSMSLLCSLEVRSYMFTCLS